MVMATYRHNSKKRGQPFELTHEQFDKIISSRCYYCGAEPNNMSLTKRDKRLGRAGLIYNGIDREDSAIGYIAANCRPCCAQCNLAKGTMSATEYTEHCQRVAAWTMFASRSIFD